MPRESRSQDGEEEATLEGVALLPEEEVALTEGQGELLEGEEALVEGREAHLAVVVEVAAFQEAEVAQASRGEPTLPHEAGEGSSNRRTGRGHGHHCKALGIPSDGMSCMEGSTELRTAPRCTRCSWC